jgi:hypothetical protein
VSEDLSGPSCDHLRQRYEDHVMPCPWPWCPATIIPDGKDYVLIRHYPDGRREEIVFGRWQYETGARGTDIVWRRLS